MTEWDEHRRKNIERNNNFLQVLFQQGDSDEFGKLGVTDTSAKSPEAPIISTGLSNVTDQSSISFLSECREKFPGRETQARRILEYLNEVMNVLVLLEAL